MLPLRHIESFLDRTPQDLQEIVFELRNIIACVAPDAIEVIRWGGLSYYHAEGGGVISAGICQIGIHVGHIRLAVIHGVFIEDPRQLFQGTQKYKRFVRLESYDQVPWEDLKDLINSAARFDPRSASDAPIK
jgi:hypothetical protein